MAASQQQKVDFLLKKIGYTASKTGLAEDSSLSGTKKAPFAEAVPSPLVIANASVWAESNLIPATPPGTDSAQVKVYLSGTSGHRMTVDSTVSGNRSYIAYSTYNDNTSAILGDWIDTQFGSSYIVKVYKGDPNAGGTALSAAGSGSSDGWFFDYSSGILNFNDTNVPTGVTDTNIYIVAYRYIGKKGVITAGAATSVTTLDVSGISTFSGGVTIGGGATVTSDLTITGGQTTVVNLNVTGVTTFVNSIYDEGNLDVDGKTDLDDLSVAGVATFSALVDADAGLDVTGHSELDNVNVSGVITAAQFSGGSGGGTTIGEDVATRNLSVSTGSTFTGAIDANGGVDISGGSGLNVVGHSELDNVNVSGVITAAQFSSDTTTIGQDIATRNLSVSTGSTFTGAIDANGGVDISGGSGLNVTGHTEVDYVNVSAAATIAGAVDINGGLDVSGGEATLASAVVSDLTSGRLTYAGTSGALQDSGNLTFVADKLGVTGGIEVSAGATFAGAIDANGALDVDGQTELDDVNVSGASTFAGAVNANAGVVASTLKVSDLTDNRLVLSGTSGELEDTSKITFDGTTLAIVGDATFTGNVSVAGTLTSEDKTELDVIGIVTARSGVRVNSGGLVVSSGVNTFTDAIDANGGLDVSGGSGLVASTVKVSDLTSGRVVVAGTSGELEDAATFTVSGGTVSATAFSATNLTGTLQTAAQANITSVGTLTALDVGGHSELDYVNVSAAATIAGAIDGNGGANFSGGETVISSATVSDLTEGRVTFAGVSGALQDSGNLTFDGTTLTAANFDGGGIGGISTTGSSNFNIIVIDSGLNVVSGVSTFQGNIDANGDISIAGNAGIGSVDVTGILTAASLVAGGSGGVTVGANNDLNAATFRVSGIATFNGAIDANGALDVDGQTDLDVLNVAETATFSDDVEFHGPAGVTSVTWDKSENLLNFKDHAKATFGTSNDLEIYHDHTTSYIKEVGTGNLQIWGDGSLEVKSGDGTETKAIFDTNGSVDLYFNNSKKFETTNDGTVTTGIATATTFSGAFEGSTVTASGDINANGNIIGDSATNISGMNNISGTSLNGTVATSSQPNITSLGSLTGLVVGGWSDLDDVYVSGVTTFFSDVVVADTIRHDGDDNTKIRFNGGDTLTIETNSAERLRVVKEGGVGIGTTNPTAAVTSANTATLAVGILTAYQLYGDGSNLSGVGFEPTTGDTGTGNLYAGTEAGDASDTDTYCNVAIGYRAGKALNSGDQNVFLGTNAGCTATAAGNNVFIGNLTGQNLLDTSSNVFVGNASGKCNRGDGNIAMGNEAFLGGSATPADNTGSHNVTLGTFAGKTITTGAENIFLGCGAGGTGAVTADHNIGLGVEAGKNVTSGAQNVHIGYKPGAELTTATGTVYIGQETAEKRQSGNHNIALGTQALYGNGTPANNTGSYNVAFGYYAGNLVDSGSSNIMLGYCAGKCATTGNCNIFLGMEAGMGASSSGVTGHNNYGIGCKSLTGLTSGCFNLAMGPASGEKLTSGKYNILFGRNAGCALTTTLSNIAIGNDSLAQNGGAHNIVLGTYAGRGTGTAGDNDASYNVIAGYYAGTGLTDGDTNVLFGYEAGKALTTGSNNTILGNSAGNCVVDGDANVMIGNYAGQCHVSGSENTYINHCAGRCMCNGSANIAIGQHALQGGSTVSANTGACNIAIGMAAGCVVSSGSNNILLGRVAGDSITTGGCNVVIGCGADVESATGDQQLAIGVGGACWISGDSSKNVKLAYNCFAVTGHAGSGSTVGNYTGVTTYYGDGSNLTGVTAGFEADADLNLMSSNTCSGCSLDGSAGCFNTLLGACAGKSLTAGYSNILIGCHAGCSLTDGYRNVIIGDRESTTPGTSGSDNVFLGWNAGRCGTSGNLNVMLGCEAGQCMTGDHNFVVGHRAGSGATGADDEILIGRDAGCLIGAGSKNVFIGCKAGTSSGTNTDNDASSNVAIGVQAGNALTDGDNNVFLGESTGANITTSTNNVFVGTNTGKCIQTGTHNLAMGNSALMGSGTPADNTGSCNIGIGKDAGACMTTAGSNVLIGCKAGNQITEGTGNVALGPLALGSGLTTGVCNIAIGLAAAACQSTGSDNIAIGQAALTGSSTPGNNTGSDNIAIGKGSGLSVTSGCNNVFMGICAGNSLTTGTCNVIIGYHAGKVMGAGKGNNVILGTMAGMCNTGEDNVIIGLYASCSNGDGQNNVIIGKYAGSSNTSGDCNTFLGNCAGQNNSSGCHNIAIGFGVQNPSATTNCQMAVGFQTNRWITGYTDFSIGGVFKNYAETYSAMGNTGTTPTIDLSDGNVFSATLNGNATFTFTMGLNLPQTATSFTLILTNDSTPSRTISWPASVKWPNNSVPSRTTAASKTDIWSFMTPDGGATWYGNIALYNFT